MLFGSGAMQDAHSRFFARTLPDTVRHENETGGWLGIGLAGPQSRELLQRITRLDVSADALKFRDTRRTFVGGVPVILNRLSFSGELGFEIYCRPQFLLLLSEAIEEAGEDLDYRWYGARTLMSLRLEKGWGAWGLEFRPDFNAVESGMDAFINWNKDFVGKAATEAFKAEGVARKLVTLTVETDMDVTLDEAVLKDGTAIGYITSGGYAHHVGRSMALAYVAAEHAEAGARVDVEIMGEMKAAEVLGAPIYDANGGRMRS
jgi:dimethylglycine dehydrogenase